MDKEELEKKKLQLEINKLNRAWVLKIDFWKVIITVVALIFSAYWTYTSGILDVERSRLKLEKAELKKEIEEFEDRRTLLKKEIQSGDSTKIVLEEQIAFYKKKESEFKKKLVLLGDKVKLSEKEKELIREENVKDKNFYIEKLKEKYAESTKFYNQLDEINNSFNNLKVKHAGVLAENKFLMSKIKLTGSEQRKLTLTRLDAEGKELETRRTDLDKRINEIEQNTKKSIDKINNMSAEELKRELELFFIQSKWNK